ncbi:MAG: hypothetical protein P1U32_02080 [Legionellaceae bacterium]|nr:hypothetical protein [Legionellaceae bacterium]
MTLYKKSLFSVALLGLSMGTYAGTASEKLSAAFDFESLSLKRLQKDTAWQLHIGGFVSSQGINQHVNITGLVGNEYSPSKKNGGNVIVGAGFLRPAGTYETFDVEYGVQIYYLPSVTAGGNIAIENVLPNLAYKYSMSFLPLYANLKLNINTEFEKTKVTLDFGIGPDFMRLNSYREIALTNATIPNDFYSSQSQTQFATLFGVGLKSDKFNNATLELAYRFFYLGNGHFSPNNNLVLTRFKTGPIYANAVTLSARV